ncbi:MAG: hypothetical protein JWR90_3797 [Marmoricola sp.]|nr:hypothetical protein [Marmoricola sp.]
MIAANECVTIRVRNNRILTFYAPRTKPASVPPCRAYAHAAVTVPRDGVDGRALPPVIWIAETRLERHQTVVAL